MSTPTIDVPISKMVPGTATPNSKNDRPEVFLNCGAWHSGETDFALVANGDIILGSWLGTAGAIFPQPTETTEGIQLTSPLVNFGGEYMGGNQHFIDFFKQANSLASPRGFVKQKPYFCINRNFKFSDDELFVFVGDCHIQLLSEWGSDGFGHNPSDVEKANGKTRVTLFPEFESFIHFCGKQVNSKENIIQIGDLYDFWETQHYFENACVVLNWIANCLIKGAPRVRFDNWDLLLSDHPRFQSLLKEGKRLIDNEGYAAWLKDRWNRSMNDSMPEFYWALLKYFGIDLSVKSGGASGGASGSHSGISTVFESFFDFGSPIANEDMGPAVIEKLINKTMGEGKSTIRDIMALVFFGTKTRQLSTKRSLVAQISLFQDSDWTSQIGVDTKFPPYRLPSNLWSRPVCQRFKDMVDQIDGVDDPLDFLSYTDLTEAIQRQYSTRQGTNSSSPSTSPGTGQVNHGFWNSFTSIQGNHDMEAENTYLKRVYTEGAITRSRALKEFGDGGAHKKNTWIDFDVCLSDDKITKRVGREIDGEKCIVCEHGHAWDPYNNRDNFFLFDVDGLPIPVASSFGIEPKTVLGINTALPGGFHTCRGWTVGDNMVFPDIGYDGDKDDSPDGVEISIFWETGKWGSNWAAIEALEAGNHARAVAIFESVETQCKSVRLIVMGHSHNPRIDPDYRSTLVNQEYKEWYEAYLAKYGNTVPSLEEIMDPDFRRSEVCHE